MSNQSVAQRLHDQLGRIIASTSPGQRLPSEPTLAEQLGVSRATLREAMRTYETQGAIRRKQGSGTYVNQPLQVLDAGLEVLESIDRMAERSGLSVSFGALDVEQRPASSEEAGILGLEAGEMLVSVTRVILTENHPAAYLVDALPVDMLNLAELQNGFKGSILDLLLQHGEPALVTSRTEIKAVPASPRVARALGIQRGDVLLCFVADLYAASGRVVDHSQSYFLPGYFRFHVLRRVAQLQSVA